MAGRGVHFALSEEEVRRLRALPDEEGRLDYVSDELEESYFDGPREYLAQTDKAWDAIHRALSDGELTWDGGSYPLNHVVLGGEQFADGESSVLSLKSPDHVRAIAEALPGVSEADFRSRYLAIDPDRYDGELGEEDFSYAWENFQDLRRLFLKAAADGRHVLFSVDL